MGDQHLDLSMRGHLGYEAMCSAMSDWILPGVLTDVAGLSSAAGLVATNSVFDVVLVHGGHRCQPRAYPLSECLCDFISGLGFGSIFICRAFAFGPNRPHCGTQSSGTQSSCTSVEQLAQDFTKHCIEVQKQLQNLGAKVLPCTRAGAGRRPSRHFAS